MTCRELIAQVQVLLGDPHGDYHTQAGLLIQVNQALRDISSRSRSVQVKQFHRAIAGQYEYGLPSGFLEMHIVAFYHVDWYQLTPATIASIESISSWVSSNIPWNYDVWGNAAREKVVANVASNTGNTLTLKAAYPNVLEGDRIINLSDKQSEGVVRSVQYDTTEDETRITYSNLQGGTRTTFETDEDVRIVSPEESMKSLVIAPPPDFSDAAGAESIWIYLSRMHRQFQQADLDRGNDQLELDIELERALLHHTLFYARGGELGFKDSETQSQAVLYESAYQTAMPHVRRRMKESISMWRRGISRSGRGDTVNEYGTAAASGHPFNRGKY